MLKTQQFTKFNQALCEVCENNEHKLKSLNFAGIKESGRNKQELLKQMLCEHDGYPNLKCINLQCQLCGPKYLLDSISEDKKK